MSVRFWYHAEFGLQKTIIIKVIMLIGNVFYGLKYFNRINICTSFKLFSNFNVYSFPGSKRILRKVFDQKPQFWSFEKYKSLLHIPIDR